jgi:two-component system LytT family sensor kinase
VGSTKLRVVIGVVGGWVLVGILWGAQTAIGANLQGDPIPLSMAVRRALTDSLPWLPVILVVIGLAARFPVARDTWKKTIWVHVAALPVVAFLANVLVVLQFGISNGSVPGFVTLLGRGAYWATLRVHVAALLYVAVAGLTHGFRYHRDSQARTLRVARLEGQLTRARLDALNAQIRPHFLFNTLHTIGHLWRSGRADEADAMLDHLGALFQRVRSTSQSFEVPLAEELETVTEYLAIEQTRFADRLRVSVNATPEARDCMVPPLVLQPLVENAIKYGVSASSAAGLVEVEARVEDQVLVIHIRDDGPGCPQGATSDNGASHSKSGSGTGLANTLARLQQLYGDRGLLDVRSREDGGCEVTIRAPAHREALLAGGAGD